VVVAAKLFESIPKEIGKRSPTKKVAGFHPARVTGYDPLCAPR